MNRTRFIGIPIRKKIAEKYRVNSKVNTRAKLDFENIFDLRQFCEEYNRENDLFSNYEKQIKTAELFAVMVITGLQEKILQQYFEKINTKTEEELTALIKSNLGDYYYQRFQKKYQQNFLHIPSAQINYETILIWLANRNPAAKKFQNIFSEADLKIEAKWSEHQKMFKDHFLAQPKFPGYSEDLISMLLLPFKRFPNSLQDQLSFIRSYWKDFIDDEMDFLLRSLDLIKEENKIGFTGSGPAYIPEYDENEDEKFTQDKDWMPNLILLAKSIYVWKDQLSRKYQRPIETLDQIPEEELSLQASRGINGIWLIGIWQRSAASKLIKELNGDKDAIASAYSLDDYQIAENLGGENAFFELKKKAQKFGIRLGCDMVPNHTGIDSKWIDKHPDWFLQLDHSPFPSYSYSGIDLSQKSSFSVFVEDHYFEKNDAAVVFKHIDHQDGKTRYIYHGNDGTSIPWNDTAQLNYLLPEVRKAVSDKIVQIARKFPIIRFDAAMTLAKKHIQRLWFPSPGSGGDIPSRSQFGMSKTEFDKLMPKEFWREVVDRIADEVPDTLLLAEAFWMMEGFFVRTLGMHRVYNSAFMNMLKNEENAKYRKTIFKVLEFNPQILKRFVNFMSNPDEETAIAQFGKDDKYFGVCLLMCTMPGLPMFAHGQIEGFHEKYGMEFQKAKWQENENEELISRHNREIFPILNKRYLFSSVENFHLFDFIDHDFGLNENVFAYSNEFQSMLSLVVYNNVYQRTKGNLQWANVPLKNNDKTSWIKKQLAEILHLTDSPTQFVIFRNMIDGLQYIRPSTEIFQQGLYLKLNGFQSAVYVDFYEVQDDVDGNYQRVNDYLAGTGTKEMEIVIKKIKLMPLLKQIHNYFRQDLFEFLTSLQNPKELKKFKMEFFYRTEEFLKSLADWENLETDTQMIAEKMFADIQKLLSIKQDKIYLDLELLLWILLRHLGEIRSKKMIAENSYQMITEYCFSSELEDLLKDKMKNFQESLEKIKLALLFQTYKEKISPESTKEFWGSVFSQNETENFLLVHKYDDELWFNQERFEELLNFVNITLGWEFSKDQKKNWQQQIDKLKKKAKSCEYLWQKFIKLI